MSVWRREACTSNPDWLHSCVLLPVNIRTDNQSHAGRYDPDWREFHRSPGHHVDAGSLVEILPGRRATSWLRLKGSPSVNRGDLMIAHSNGPKAGPHGGSVWERPAFTESHSGEENYTLAGGGISYRTNFYRQEGSLGSGPFFLSGTRSNGVKFIRLSFRFPQCVSLRGTEDPLPPRFITRSMPTRVAGDRAR
jgi:hypothetical protein